MSNFRKLSDLFLNLQKMDFSKFDEATLKQTIILRIFSLLNWDIFDSGEVHPEYSVGGKRVDYALISDGRARARPKTTLKHFLKIHHPSGQGHKWPSVQEAYKYFNPDKIYQQTHRATQDAKIEAEIIHQAVEKWPVLKNQWEDYI